MTDQTAVPQDEVRPVETEAHTGYMVGDEDEIPPPQLVPSGTTLEMRIVGEPRIQAGQGKPSEKYPNGYRYAFFKFNLLPADETSYPDCEFIRGDISFPSPDDSVKNFNAAGRKFAEFKQAVGWKPPRFDPLVSDGMTFPELKNATVKGRVVQKYDEFNGGMENQVQQWSVEKD